MKNTIIDKIHLSQKRKDKKFFTDKKPLIKI